MTPERWRQVKAIFDVAVECTPASRAELIRQSCGNDQELRREVESLLASDRETGSHLDSPLKLVAAGRSKAVGTRLGPYEILAVIGAGGMGEVYKARDARLDRAVAIKVLPESFASDADRLRRFEIEAKAAGALNHPNILVVHDIGSDGGSPYLVSELLEGESLASRLKRGKLDVRRTVDYGKQIAAGLAAAHSKGISHRDIKPDNLYLTKDGRVKILDFGLAKATTPRPGDGTAMSIATSAGTIMGTAAYMSPEQARGQAVDQRSDIFSFGCVLYEMLTGERAFKGDTSADVMSAILSKDPDLKPIEIPALGRIVAHCLEKTQEQRFQSASDIAFDLDALTQAGSGPHLASAPAQPNRNWLPWAVAAALTLACAALGWLYFSPKPDLQFHRLTFRRGGIQAARFTPDGNSVIYSAKWEDEPTEVFTARLDSPGSRPLGFPGSELFSVSGTGDLALAQNKRVDRNPFASAGMLARAPLSGGAPRSIEDGVDFAEWSPDGKEMAEVKETDQGTQLEFPAGKVLYRTAGYIGEPRISPAGDRIAFLDHPLRNSNQGRVAVVDLAGNKKTLTAEYLAAEGLAWAPKGDEVWFTAARIGARTELRAVTLAGRERVVFRQSIAVVLHDISRSGRVLLANVEYRMQAMFRGASDAQERELSWLDCSLVTGISRDGKFILISESGEGAGGDLQIYLRESTGAPAVLLGPAGNNATFSPDDQSVVTVTPDHHDILIYPVGPGQSKRIPMPGYVVDSARLFPDGKRVWFTGREAGRGRRSYITDLSGAKPRALTPEGQGGSLSPDGAYFLITPPAGKSLLYPIAGGKPQEVPIAAGEQVAGWSRDGQELFVFNRNGLPSKVYRVNWKTSHRELMREIAPADRAGTHSVMSMKTTPDGRTYAYSRLQYLSELHMVEGLK
jgi:serine/threonine protein kinase/Tol biopolymer transport system component